MDDQNDINSSYSGLPPELIALMYDDSLDMDIINRHFSNMEKSEHKIIEPNSKLVSRDLTKNSINSNIDIKTISVKPIKTTNRCKICNKKVGLLGFVCKCEDLFCSKHRYPDGHNCQYDYKSNKRKQLEQDNPRVVADKIRKL